MTEPEKYTVGRAFKRALWWLFLCFAVPFIAGMIYQVFVVIGVINDPLPSDSPSAPTTSRTTTETTTQAPEDDWEPITLGDGS